MMLLLSFLAPGITLISTWLYGDKNILGPLIGLISIVPWILLGAVSGAYGLIVVQVFFGVIHVRNIRAWSR